MASWRTRIPAGLIVLRLLLAPTMLVVATTVPEPGWWLVAILCVGMASDIADGIVARHLGVQTARLRRFDSQADLVFWLTAMACVWILHPDLVRSHGWAIAALLALEGLTYLVSFLRFGRETCTHSYLAKAWGLTIFVAFVNLLGRGEAGIPFWVMWGAGVAADLDVILITLLLPDWNHDVPTAWHAWRLRRGHEVKRYRLFN